MKTIFVLLSLAVVVSSAHAQEQESAVATPPLMAACEAAIKGANEHTAWIGDPVQYSKTGHGGWIGKTATFKPAVPGMTAENVMAVDGSFAMWSRNDKVKYVYAAYKTTNTPDPVVYFLCKADARSGAVINVIERSITQASADE
jgi:hypothetical protein